MALAFSPPSSKGVAGAQEVILDRCRLLIICASMEGKVFFFDKGPGAIRRVRMQNRQMRRAVRRSGDTGGSSTHGSLEPLSNQVLTFDYL